MNRRIGKVYVSFRYEIRGPVLADYNMLVVRSIERYRYRRRFRDYILSDLFREFTKQLDN